MQFLTTDQIETEFLVIQTNVATVEMRHTLVHHAQHVIRNATPVAHEDTWGKCAGKGLS